MELGAAYDNDLGQILLGIIPVLAIPFQQTWLRGRTGAQSPLLYRPFHPAPLLMSDAPEFTECIMARAHLANM